MAKRRRRGSGLVIHRELARTARRWQRIPLRMAAPAVVLGIFVIALSSTSRDFSEGDQLARFGKDLFVGLFVLYAFACMALPAVQISQAVQAERDGGTLDLLAITGIRPRQVLFGVLSFRTVRVLLSLAAAAPLIALVPTLGGVGTDQALIAALVLGGILAATVAVASLLAISADSPAVAVVGTAAWWILCGLLAPIRLTLVTDSVYGTERFYGFPFPYAIEPRMTETDLVLSLVPWVVTALVAIPVTSWRFSRGIATGWDRLGTSWPGWRYLWVPLLVAVAAGWGWLEAIGGWDRYDHGYRGVDATTQVVAMAVHVLVLSGASILLLQTFAWLAPRLSLSRRRFRIPLFGDPILWREVVTSGQGGLTRAITIATATWALIAVLMAVADANKDLFLAWSILAALGVYGVSVLLAVSSIVEERRRRTLALVLATTLPPWRVVFGKALGAAIRFVPLATMGVGLSLLSYRTLLGPADLLEPYAVQPYEWSALHYVSDLPGSSSWILQSVPFARPLALIAWGGSLWAFLLTLGVFLALSIRNRAAAMAVPLTASFFVLLTLVVAAVALRAASQRMGVSALWSELLYPIIPLSDASPYTPGIPGSLLLAIAFWISGAAVLLWLATRRLRRAGAKLQ